MKPRIYVYKITFADAPYYYFGVHKERKFDEYYMGSPITHKEIWKKYKPQKEILKTFDNTVNGWHAACKLEKSMIRPVYNKDHHCLNENCGGTISIDVCRNNGLMAKDNKLGIYGLTEEDRKEYAKQGGIALKNKKLGIHANTSEQHSVNARKAAKITNSLRYQCTITKRITTPGALTNYQKARNIDTSNRVRLLSSY